MPRACASRRVRSTTSRRRSPCACSRRRPAPPVRCAPPRRGASIVTMGAPWRTCPGPSIGCASSCASANGFAAIAPVRAASSQNACPPWPPPGRGARCGSRRASWPSASLWEGRLERRQPVALLPERTAEPVAQWLREHPGVEVIARDRASAYAEGARHGAPGATQVADRFHVLQNLAEALTHVFATHGRALDAVNATEHPQPVPLPDGTSAVSVPPPPTPPAEEARAAARAARRQAR